MERLLSQECPASSLLSTIWRSIVSGNNSCNARKIVVSNDLDSNDANHDENGHGVDVAGRGQHGEDGQQGDGDQPGQDWGGGD